MNLSTTLRFALLLSFTAIVACDGDDKSEDTASALNDDSDETSDTTDGGELPDNVWSGSTITFTLANGSDPTLEENQDRITDNVWITRSPVGGPIYNAAVEDEPTEEDLADMEPDGPVGTEWAEGSLSSALDLSYGSLKDIGGGGRGAFQQLVGKDLVMHLIEDDVYISVSFTSWTAGSSGERGGFAYERSTEP